MKDVTWVELWDPTKLNLNSLGVFGVQEYKWNSMFIFLEKEKLVILCNSLAVKIGVSISAF